MTYGILKILGSPQGYLMPFSTSMSSIHFHLPSCFMIHFLYLPSMRGGFFYFLSVCIHFRTYQPKIPPPTKYGIPTARPITANTARKTTAQTTIQSSGIYRKHLSFMLNLLDGWVGKTPTHAFSPIFLMSRFATLDNIRFPKRVSNPLKHPPAC